MCDLRECQLQFRLQNSYGRSWQEDYDNGWVNADYLSEQIMADKGMMINTVLPKGTSLDSKLVAPYFNRSPVSRSTSMSSLQSKSFATNESNDKCWEVSESSITYIRDEELPKPVYRPIPTPVVRPAPTPTPNPDVQPTPVPDQNPEVEPPVEKKMYVCVGPDGERYAGDLKKEGWKCKEIKF